MGNKISYIKKILRTMLLLAPVIICSSILLFSGIKAEAAVTGTVTASSLFVREGPGTQYEIKKSNGTQIRLLQGDYVAVSWEENGWYYIDSVFEGKKISGYVSKDYVKTSGTIPTGRPAATPTPQGKSGTEIAIPEGTTLAVVTKGFPYSGYVAATTLNIRDGAGTGYNIIDTLKEGDKVTVTGVKKSNVGAYWYTVEYVKNGVSCKGTTSATYIAVYVGVTKTPTPAPSSGSTKLRTEGFPFSGTVAADALNVRSAAGTSSARLTILLSKEKVTVLGVEKASDGTWWYKVTFTKNNKEYTGYVISTYLSVEGAGQQSTPTPIPTRDPYENVVRYFEIPANDRGSLYYGAVINNVDSLNMRETAALSGKLVAKLKENTRVIVLDRVEASGHWYKIAVKQNGKVMVGYASTEFVKLEYEDAVYGVVLKNGTILRAQPNGSSASAVNADGIAIAYNTGDRVLLTGETEVGGEKWFQVKASDGTVGYVICIEVELIGGNVLTTSPTPTPTPTPSATPTSKYTPTPAPTKRPTSTPRPTGYPTPIVKNAEDGYPLNFADGYCTGYGAVSSKTEATIYVRPFRNDESLRDSNGSAITAKSGMSLALFNKYKSGNDVFRQVRLVYNNKVYFGYVDDSLIVPFEESEYKLRVTPTPVPNMAEIADDDFIFLLEDSGFTDSYIEKICEIHKIHPTWIFEAFISGLDWNTVIEEESKVGNNLIPNTYKTGMLSTEPGAYDWTKDKYVIFDSPHWVTASKEANEYYIDPRNWLDDTSIFMFEDLSYKEKYQTLAQVEELLRGTPFYNKTFTYKDDLGVNRTISYAQAFLDAAEYSGVSPFHLVTRARQEVVIGTSSYSDSVSGTVSGYQGYYNFYNIGAYHSTVAGGAIINGLKYAKNGKANSDEYNDASLIPWDNRYKAIVGGAYILGQQYISRGQDTIYTQKFNVSQISTFGHQYMSNIEAPQSEAAKMAKAYTSSDTTVVFKIPVYENMPEEPAKKPTSDGNPNNVLAALNVFDMDGNLMTLSPSFDALSENDYYITTTEGNNVLQIMALAASGKATVRGNGTVVVNSNSDVFEITVTAENGDVRTYRIHASKQ